MLLNFNPLGGAGAFQHALQGASDAAASGAAGSTTGSGGGTGFGQLLDSLTRAQEQGNQAMTDLATGAPRDLHDVMLAVEGESLAFDLAVQMRNKIVDAYQEIFRMSV